MRSGNRYSGFRTEDHFADVGKMPEDLPTPEKSIAQIEREQEKRKLGGKGKA